MTELRAIPCAPRHLPRSEWPTATANAIKQNPDNRPPGLEEDEVPRTSIGERLALDVTRYWGKEGVKLTVGFIETRDRALRERILLHLNAWNKTANVEFVESNAEPQVRIARFTAREAPGDDGYWSNLGTDVLLIRPPRPTMNLEAFTMQTQDSEFHRVVRHEGGHTLGFPHEHMRKEIIAKLDREKVIAEFMRTQSWTRQEVIDQVLTPLEESSLLGTVTAEADSIMCYEIAGNLTRDGQPVVGGTDITKGDFAFAAQVYPKRK